MSFSLTIYSAISPVPVCTAGFFIIQPCLFNQILKYCKNLAHSYFRLFLVYFHFYVFLVQMNSGLLHYRWRTGQVWLLPPSHTNTAEALKWLWHLLYDYLMAILSGMKKAASERPLESFNNRNRLSWERADREKTKGDGSFNTAAHKLIMWQSFFPAFWMEVRCCTRAAGTETRPMASLCQSVEMQGTQPLFCVCYLGHNNF